MGLVLIYIFSIRSSALSCVEHFSHAVGKPACCATGEGEIILAACEKNTENNSEKINRSL